MSHSFREFIVDVNKKPKLKHLKCLQIAQKESKYF